jgi:TDG/mug DNA glycosylase family protein
MDRVTAETYEQRGASWAANRKPIRRGEARAFNKRVPRGTLRLDAGAGAGRYTNEIGDPVVALDAAGSMLELLRDTAPRALPVRADLEALPFRRGAFGAVWANMSYQHVPRRALPLALADLHRSLAVDAAVDIQVSLGSDEAYPADDDVGRRLFTDWEPAPFDDVLLGAGFSVAAIDRMPDRQAVRARAHRARSLPDTVGADMRVLVCGLNPSIYAADHGVGFARPGNRFWPAAVAAGLVSRERDPWHALVHHRVGMTDLCKRATATSRELTRDEYRAGAARVERLVEWLQPGVVVFVGLEGWRAAIDRQAQPGVQGLAFGGRPAYVMPSTSGLNARTPLSALTAHLEDALRLGG